MKGVFMTRAFAGLFGAAVLAVLVCTPAPVKREAADEVTGSPAVKDTAAGSTAQVRDVAAASPAPVIGTATIVVEQAGDSASRAADSAAPKHNDTAIVLQILNECGLLSVKPEEVTEWDSAGRAVSLNLSNRDLSKDGITLLPALVCSLTELCTLSAKNNTIAAIPLELFKLKNLVKLDLASNKISFIPPAVSELENLEILDLRYNGFGFLPSEIGSLKKLVFLQLWGNRMVELEPAVTQLPALKELYLKDNRLTSLPEGITTMKSLVYYDLTGNSICKPSAKIDAWLKQKDKRYREAQRCR
jgi:hypothetical protein